MGSIHYPYLTVDEVSDWVFQAVADGTSCVFTIVESNMICDLTVKKIKAFIEACKYVEKMLNEGASRKQVGKYVSDNGKKSFGTVGQTEALKNLYFQ